jgi:hypothetical protein
MTWVVVQQVLMSVVVQFGKISLVVRDDRTSYLSFRAQREIFPDPYSQAKIKLNRDCIVWFA